MPKSYIKCEECEEKIPNNKWGHIKADDWFFQKDGKSYCPRHIPEWVPEWRKKNALGS